jgi:hypothetical protein
MISNSNISEKIPDSGLYPRDRKWPTLALEAGYSEPYDDLVEDSELLLKWSKGRIGLVILVKIEPLKSSDTEIQNGFVEVHKFDKETERRVKYGGRKVKSLLYFFPFSITNCS